MKLALLVFGLAGFAAAHMRLARPEPLGLASDPEYLGPLERFNEQKPFPCRGHLSDLPGAKVQSVWPAGSSQTFQLAGQTPHYGGSSQVSLSYDNGKTWKVIKSFPGSCPHRLPGDEQIFNFKVPEEAPAGKALFSWSWFNREEEMYHNCALVEISGGNGKGLGAFPDMFIADIKQTKCRTPRTKAETLFPNMGKDESRIEYGDGEYPLELPTC